MKKIVPLIFSILLTACLYSCVKNRNDINTDFGSLKPFLELRAPDFPGAGTPNFAGIDHFENADISALTTANDTVIFYVNIASVNTFRNPTNVTVGLDENLIKSYNDTSQLEYTVLPGFAYKQLDKNVTIPANERVAQIRVVFKSALFSQLDPTLNYMLPITVLKNDGIDVSENEGTVWFHKIGNCIAGMYDVSGTAEAYTISGTDTILTSTSPIYFTPKPIDPDPQSPSTALADYGNQGPAGWRYIIVFDCSTNTITSLRPNEVMYANIRVNSFTLLQPPTYDPVTQEFHFVTSYLNSSGNLRTTDETFTKQ